MASPFIICNTKNVANNNTDCRVFEKTKGVPAVPYSEVQLKGVFKSSDANGDGRLSRQELRNAFASLGSFAPGWRACRALRRADKNRDGFVDEDELDYLVKYAAKRGYTIK
ncbi:Parvalbumin [Trema orientale]|uniref:Parvalbumin n=1 Tax=Trema orientale TaxID=63057 RepID=A0A2P5F8Q2_TREOI|nr:Parvalbumin [Trema orientale]